MITLVGLISLVTLPVARYPQISPPQVVVRTSYMGASAEVVGETVASIIEKQIIGVQNMDYMVSTSSGDGGYNLTIQFDQGTDADMNTVNTQNRVARALAQLPQEVQAMGVTATKSSGDMAFVFSLTSPNNTYDQTFMKNYASVYMMTEIQSVQGVGSVQEFGADFAMRLWLNPSKMAQYGITVGDVRNAIATQNKQAAAGALGSDPISTDQQFNTSVKVSGRLQDIEEFKQIVIKKDRDGNLLHLKDIARIELGSAGYNVSAKGFDLKDKGKAQEVAVFALSLTPDANAIRTISEVKEVLQKQEAALPPDMKLDIIVDNTNFVKASIKEVVKTFIEALVLVGLIVYLFLQSWRSTIIPMIAVPVSLLGTFAVFQVLGFTINTLTLFAMVLAIGLVVDDAIVVIEAVEYEMKYNGKGPKEATFIAMKNVEGPVIGIAFVLISVFIPVSFMGGMTGILYKQFALTIAVSVVISAFIALTLTPALCGTMLQPHVDSGTGNWLQRGLHKFNVLIDRFTDWYGYQLARLAKKLWVTVVTLVVFVVATLGIVRMLPSAFVPAEDGGYYMVAVSLPPGATSSRTADVIDGVGKFLSQDEDMSTIVGITGFDLLAGAMQTSGGIMFASLNDWSERPSPQQSVYAKVGKTFGYAAKEPRGNIMAMNPPAIPGLGSTGGFSMYIINKNGDSVSVMSQNVNNFLAEARKSKVFSNVYTTFNESTPTYDFDINRDKAARDGVALPDIYMALQGFYGGMQINDFTQYGKNYKVSLQADDEFRTSPSMNSLIHVRNGAGQMVPLSAYITPKQTTSAFILTRFDNYPAIKIGGSNAPGYSSGEAITELKAIAARTLPTGYSYDWADQSREEIKAGSQTILIFGLGLVFVFLVLAALYESWKVPFAVLLSVPTGILGAFLGPWLINLVLPLNLSANIYLQIGLLTLVGLAAKNAILIIEYAKVRVEQRGMNYVDAAIEASKIRLRPILMTSLAFILGCIPLALSTGAGSGARMSLGITVVIGMLTATIFGIFMIPMLFIIVEKFGFKKEESKTA